MSEFLIFVPVFNEENNLHLVFKELFNLKTYQIQTLCFLTLDLVITLKKY